MPRSLELFFIITGIITWVALIGAVGTWLLMEVWEDLF